MDKYYYQLNACLYIPGLHPPHDSLVGMNHKGTKYNKKKHASLKKGKLVTSLTLLGL